MEITLTRAEKEKLGFDCGSGRCAFCDLSMLCSTFGHTVLMESITIVDRITDSVEGAENDEKKVPTDPSNPQAV